MCDFVSGIIDKDERILFFDLHNHSKTAEYHNLVGQDYREFEWTGDDDGSSLSVRVLPGQDESWYKSLILSRWKTRKELINSLPESVQLAAVKEDGYAIEYIQSPSESLQLANVKN